MSERNSETIVLNLKLDRISIDDLVRISEIAEKTVRTSILKSVGERFVEDLTITVHTEIKEGLVTITIDVSFAAPKILGLDYEGIIDRACDEAFKAIEEVLKRYGETSDFKVEKDHLRDK